MKEKINTFLSEIATFEADSKEALELFRIKFLGTKSVTKELFANFKNVPNEQKKEVGQLINEIKEKAQEKFDFFQSKLNDTIVDAEIKSDLTRTAFPEKLGSRHPISLVRKEILKFFHA